jgi:N-acyl-D-amino-acid deacylase
MTGAPLVAATLLLAWAAPGPLPAVPPGAPPDSVDVILRGGRLLDGTGNPWIRGDVAVRGERVVAVGRLDGWRAQVELDVSGLYVAPGFIDVHSHAAEGLASEDRSHGFPQLAQGITTVVVNPDGGGDFDLARQRVELLRDGLGVNVAQLVPHGSIRAEVVGMADREATAWEMERMKALVGRAMEDGAFGLSSGPFYVPGRYADTRELVELARVAAAHGGIYTSHIRDESDYDVGVLAAVEEVITVAREAGLPGIVTHVKALGPPVWGFSAPIIRRIEAARAEGVEVFADQYPYLASATSLAAALVPGWAQEGGRAGLRDRLRDPEARVRIEAAMEENLRRRGGAERIQFRRHEPDPSIEGRTLAEVAALRGLDGVGAAMALLEEGSPAIVSFNMDERDVAELMRQPWTMTSSDGAFPAWGEGVPHPRSYGAFPRKIRKYAVEDGVVSLEHAVRSMTSLPARVHRMWDRGLLQPGAVADLVVFDLARVNDPATFTDPHRLAEGMVHVLVNGAFAIRNGEFTDVRTGRVLRRQSDPHGPSDARRRNSAPAGLGHGSAGDWNDGVSLRRFSALCVHSFTAGGC